MSPLVTMWSIDEEDELKVQTEDKENKDPVNIQEVEKEMAENEVYNTKAAAPADADEIAEAIAKSPDPAKTAARHSSASEDLKAALAQAGAGPAIEGASPSSGALSSLPQSALSSVQEGKDVELPMPGAFETSGEDKQAQTGEVSIKTVLASGVEKEHTVLQGANAHNGEDVVVGKDELSAE